MFKEIKNFIKKFTFIKGNQIFNKYFKFKKNDNIRYYLFEYNFNMIFIWI